VQLASGRSSLGRQLAVFVLTITAIILGDQQLAIAGCGQRDPLPRLSTSIGPDVKLSLSRTAPLATRYMYTVDLVERYAHRKPSAYYIPDGPTRNSYARFSGTDSVLEWMYGGQVLAKSNLAAGCALWEWWWNGIEFINDYDYGRQVQVAVYPADGGSGLGEAGDVYGIPSIGVDARHPSPCVSFSTNRSSSSPSQMTAAAPLEWCPEYFGGGADHPIVYPAVRLGKTLTLNWRGPDNVDRSWPVALFQTVINSPAISRAAVEAPTGYLNSAFNTYYHYNPATRTLAQDLLSDIQAETARGRGYNVKLPTGPMAVILAEGTGSAATAMGIYINNPNSGFVFYDNSIGSSPGQSGSNFVKWEVRYDGSISARAWTYNTWIMTDSVQNILKEMNQLYSWSVSSR
jgi:hypothetical protein